MRTRALAAGLCFVLAACASPPSTTSPPGQSPGSSSRPSSSASAVGFDGRAGPVDIGDGRTLYVVCEGSGSPTILMEAGDEVSIDGWRPAVEPLASQTRVCSYERAGIGRSSQATGCRGMDDLLGDLEAMLSTAGIDGPYILVGSSGGGFIITAYAMRHPDQVAGIVLVETPKALTAALYPEVLPQIACDAPRNIEHRDYLAVEHAAWDNRHQIGDFPMTVISNDYGEEVAVNTDEYTNVEDQHDWLVLTSAEGKQVVVTTGHTIDQPQLVADEILAVLEAARAQ